MRNLLLLWGRGIRSAIANRIAYRGDFLISMLVMLLFEMITPLLTLLIYGLTGGMGFPGWDMYEVLLIQAVYLLSRGVAQPFFFSLVWTVHQQVREGIFELTLLRPRSEILVCMTQNIDIQSFGRLGAGFLFFLFVLSRLPAPGIEGIVAFCFLFPLSLLVYFSLTLIMAATLFVWIGNSRLFELLDTLLHFARYPGSIFSSVFQVLTTVVIPVGMIALFPAEALLGRPMTFVLPSCMAVLVFSVLSFLFWKTMVRKYTGAGG